jgi:hypothetical protein
LRVFVIRLGPDSFLDLLLEFDVFLCDPALGLRRSGVEVLCFRLGLRGLYFSPALVIHLLLQYPDLLV